MISSLIFINFYLCKLFQISWLVLDTSKMFHINSDANGSLFRLWLILWHVMLDIILITCLVVIAVAWLVLNIWECIMCHERIMFVSIKHKIVVFSFDALFGLTWRMLISCYDFKPVTLSLYDHLVFDLWYHFMLWLICFVAMHYYGHYCSLSWSLPVFC